MAKKKVTTPQNPPKQMVEEIRKHLAGTKPSQVLLIHKKFKK